MIESRGIVFALYCIGIQYWLVLYLTTIYTIFSCIVVVVVVGLYFPKPLNSERKGAGARALGGGDEEVGGTVGCGGVGRDVAG